MERDNNNNTIKIPSPKQHHVHDMHSSMERGTFAVNTDHTHHQINIVNESVEAKTLRIKSKRGVFKFLPVHCDNDLVHGAWWYFWGSVVTILIPIMPLLALYQGWWPDATDSTGELLMPKTPHAIGYGLMELAGLWYTAGSYIFIECFRDEHEHQKKNRVNTMNCSHYLFRNDELLAIWCFIVGTVPFIPCMLLYVLYNPTKSEFKLALGLIVGMTFAMLIYVLAIATEKENSCYIRTLKFLDPCLQVIRSKNEKNPEDFHVNIIAPCLKPCCCCIKRHVASDFLIASWIILLGCAVSILVCLGLLFYSVKYYHPRGIYDYFTCWFDMIFFFVGSLYITAGSYKESSEGEVSVSLSLSAAEANGAAARHDHRVSPSTL